MIKKLALVTALAGTAWVLAPSRAEAGLTVNFGFGGGGCGRPVYYYYQNPCYRPAPIVFYGPRPAYYYGPAYSQRYYYPRNRCR
jgi:hypothetical protein